MTYNVSNSMKDTTQATDNDYAVAHAFNNCVLGITAMIVLEDVIGSSPEKEDFNELNRAYVLVVEELEKIYDRNPKLSGIQVEPIWKRFDVLKTSVWDINEYLENPDNDLGQAHNARVEKLMILADKEIPDFTNDQKKLLDHANSVRSKYGKLLDKLSKEWRENKLNDWQIAEYRIEYKPDGTILINDVLKLKKAHAGSITERLLEQCQKHPNEQFKPELGQTSRNISTVLNSAGFTPTLRQLFFPIVSSSKGILFRHTITRDQADKENIITAELDLTLKDLGAETEPKSAN
jgi:hypothetical protein